jgi:colanic acid/amylovoran biosynthesis glycosyltransferase
MRILHTFGDYLRTTENWAYRLISSLEGVDIVVAALRFVKADCYDPRFEYIEFPIRPLGRPRKGFLDRALNTLLSYSIHLYPAYLKHYAKKLDLIHSHTGGVGCFFQGLADTLGVPHVVSFYGADYCTAREKKRKLYRKLFQKASLCICEGKCAAATLKTLGCPPEKIRILHLGVTPQSVPFFKRTKRAGELTLLQIASWREKKGHVYTLRSFRMALAKCPDMTLTLVGGDPTGLLSKLTSDYEDLINTNKLRLLDSIPFSAMHDFMKDYQVFIHPSCEAANGDAEGGAPVVLLDAQATGMPVIATRHCDIPEEVRHGQTGLLVDEKDSGQLCDAVERFYNMAQNEYDAFAQAATRHVGAHYDVDASAVQLRALYDDLIARKEA